MTETEIAWLAGWLEGEGCFSLTSGSSPTITVAVTDKDVIERAAKLVGGKASPIKKYKGHVKQVYRIGLHGQKAIDVMTAILPHMGERRGTKISEILNYYKGKPDRIAARSARHSEFMKNKWKSPDYQEYMKPIVAAGVINAAKRRRLLGCGPRDSKGKFIAKGL